MFLEISLVHNFLKSGEANTSNLMPLFIVIIHWIWIDELEEQQRPHPPEKKMVYSQLANIDGCDINKANYQYLAI